MFGFGVGLVCFVSWFWAWFGFGKWACFGFGFGVGLVCFVS